MKKVHALVLKSFAGPFLASFSVSLFILVLQFLTKHQNDIFGKGLEPWVVARVFMLAAVQLTVLALPIATLISTLSTMGKMGENYELAALKSAGVSLARIMYPLMFVCGFLAIFAVSLAFYLIPESNLKLYSLLYDAKKAKPSFALEPPGFFDYKFDGYVIYHNRRSDDGTLYDLKIWDHTDSPAYETLLTADSARIDLDYELYFMRLKLYSGARHEPRAQQNAQRVKDPYSRVYFDSALYKIDLSGLGMKRTDEDAFRSHRYMLNIKELYAGLDSVNQRPVNILAKMGDHSERGFYYKTDSLLGAAPARPRKADVLAHFDSVDRAKIVSSALTSARSTRSFAQYTAGAYDRENEWASKFGLEMHRRVVLPLSVLLMLFIGAPLGAIIRKGGLAAPTVVSLIFFVLFYALMSQGEKLAREDKLEVWTGAWLPMIIIIPMAVYLTRQSNTDSRIFDADLWKRLVRFSFLKSGLRKGRGE